MLDHRMGELEEDPRKALDRRVRGLQIGGGLTNEEVAEAKAKGRQRAEKTRNEVKSWPSSGYPNGRLDED